VIVKKANKALVVDTVRRSGPLTIEDMVAAAGLSRPTVVSIVRALEKRHIIGKSGLAVSEVGRQPTLYAIDETSLFAIGIDIDGPPARLVLATLTGAIRHEAVWSLDPEASSEQIIETLTAEVNRSLNATGISASSILGIGLGLPASVDLVSNRAINLSRLESLRDAPVGDRLAVATGIPVHVRNDAHLMALAENARSQENYLYIAFRTGVGLAIVIDSQVFEGETGNAGFIGHTCLDPVGPMCPCGARGCLEAVVSKRAIMDKYATATGIHLAYAQILNGAAEGSQAAAEVILNAGRWLGLAIANLIKTTDIYTVVLGDLGCDENHPFFTAIETVVAEHTSTFFRHAPNLRAGKLSGAQFALGGAQFVIDQFFATPRLRVHAEH
jgi:predicted NBD/HSP70 family sugar kinase